MSDFRSRPGALGSGDVTRETPVTLTVSILQAAMIHTHARNEARTMMGSAQLFPSEGLGAMVGSLFVDAADEWNKLADAIETVCPSFAESAAND